MVAINDNFEEKPDYNGGKFYGGNKNYADNLGYFGDSYKKTAEHDCGKCGSLPVGVTIIELNEGRNYLGSFNFRPMFTTQNYYLGSSTVQPDIGLGYTLQFNGNIINLLKKMRDTPKEVHLEDKIMASVFETFDLKSGKLIYTTESNANTLADLATAGVDYIFKHPEETKITNPRISNFLGISGVRFSSTNVCIPKTEELMSFLREQWRKK